MAVIARNAEGKVTVKEAAAQHYLGTDAGLAVGGLVGLLGGPAVGAVRGSVAGAIRDFWVAGVDLDFVENTERLLVPGKVAVVAEVEEEWVSPVDSALEAAGGSVFRRVRSEVAESEFDHGIAAFKGEIRVLEVEAANASGAVRAGLEAQVATAKAGLGRATLHAKQRIESLEEEADGKATVLKDQISIARGDAKSKLQDRASRVKSAYHARGVKLSQAWGLTKEALAA